MPRTPVRFALLASLALALLAAAPAFAQRPPPDDGHPHTLETLRVADDGARYVLSATWSARDRGRRTATVSLARLDERGQRVALAQLYRGAPVLAALAARGDAALAVLYSGGDHPFVRAVTYRPGDAAHPTRAVELAPTAAASAFYPFAAVAAPTPDGFTVLFQDHGGQTYLARLAPDGSVRTPAASVAVPWSLAALAWNDHGYHLAVYYDGAGPSDTRLCLVTLTPDGQPEQHPWWASPRGAIGEVQMASARDGMRVEYRLDDGTSGLRTFTSRAQGQWGIEAPAPQNDGALAAGELFALRRGADGAVSTERVAAR